MQVQAGNPYPLGATVRDGGVNFALYAAHASEVTLCLFLPQEVALPLTAREGFIWHGFVAGLDAGTHYGFRVVPQAGAKGNPQKLLLDPCAREVSHKPDFSTPEALAFYQDNAQENASMAPKSVVVAGEAFAWQGDAPLNRPWAQVVIYEAQVKGLTRQFPDLSNAGTYQALADSRVIDYLQSLGITALELLPVQMHIDEIHLQQKGLRNYWGYNTVAPFALEPDYSATAAGKEARAAFKSAVQALHQAGIEVYLDIVFNHTAEQDADGPILCQKGIDATTWYWHDAAGELENWTGCGNSLKVANAAVSRWVLDCLRYWVKEFHVDGFRFDLGTLLGREPAFATQAAFFNALQQDSTLTRSKLIAEPWDIGEGGYQLGQFPYPFAEWNDQFRDVMRRFWVLEDGDLGEFCTRFAGSADLFAPSDREPAQSIHFICAHDGFTLEDLVSYDHKHNELNDEGNRDGHAENFSANHGVEGTTADAEITARREDTVRAVLASVLLAKGTPMLLAGDEFGHSQGGNNNAYCQDNALTWLDWAQANAARREYVEALIALRKRLPWTNDNRWFNAQDVAWLNTAARAMTPADWHNQEVKAMQIQIAEFLLVINGKAQAQTFQLPSISWCMQLAANADYALNNQELTVFRKGVWILQT